MNLATVILVALASSIAGSIVLAAGTALLVRSSHFTAASRHKLWFMTLLAVAGLPFISAGVSLARAQQAQQAQPAQPAETFALSQKNLGAETSPARVAPARRIPATAHRLATRSWAAASSLPAAPRFAGLGHDVFLALDAAFALGALAGLAMLALSVYGLRRVKGRSIPLDDSLADDLPWLSAPSAGREAYLRLSHEIEVPVAIGFRRPVILIPVDLATHSGLRAIEDLVVHEHAHLRHYDDWTNLVQRAIERLFWFNPVVWYVGRRIALEREMAADDAVIARSADVVRYAESLLRMARQMRMPAYAVVAPGALFTRRQISTRIEALLAPGRERLMGLNPMSLVAGFALALLSSTVVAVAAPPLQLPASQAVAAIAQQPAHAAVQPRTQHAATPSRSAHGPQGAAPEKTESVVRWHGSVNVHSQERHAVQTQQRHTVQVAQRDANSAADSDADADAEGSADSDAESASHPAVAKVRVPPLNVRVPATNVHVPPVNVHVPDVKVQVAGVNVQVRALLDQLSPLQVPGVQVHVPAVNVKVPAMQIAQGDPLTRELVSRCVGCDLSGRDLRNLDLHGITLSGADLNHADLRGANLSDATLNGVDLSHANLDGANLSGARLTGADIQGATFRGAHLEGVRLTGTSFRDASFDATALRAILATPCNGCDLSRMNLRGIDWHGIALTGVDLSHADLTGANLNGIRLTGVDLSHAKLDGVDLRNAVLIGCDFDNASLSGARLAGISLTGTSLSQ